jgi:hypothetical protein
LKALPRPGFFAWPGGQKPRRLAPCRLATSERELSPVVLACGGTPVTPPLWPRGAAVVELMLTASNAVPARAIAKIRMEISGM